MEERDLPIDQFEIKPFEVIGGFLHVGIFLVVEIAVLPNLLNVFMELDERRVQSHTVFLTRLFEVHRFLDDGVIVRSIVIFFVDCSEERPSQVVIFEPMQDLFLFVYSFPDS